MIAIIAIVIIVIICGYCCSYPVIVSIENHCSVKQQQAMVQCLKTTLGDKLHTEPPPKDLTQMPSPHQLKGKILIKVKVVSNL